MKTAEHIPEDELALVALNELEPEAAALAVAHLRYCDACRDELARLQGDLVLYALSAPVQAPAPETRARLLQAVAQEAKMAPAAPASAIATPAPAVEAPTPISFYQPVLAEEEPPRSRAFNWLGWALAACLAALAGWQFLQMQDLRRQVSLEANVLTNAPFAASGDLTRARDIVRTLTDASAIQVALHEPSHAAEARPSGHVAYDAASGDLIFVASHLRSLRENRTYELWLLPASGANPIPAGLFRPDLTGSATVVLPELPKGVVAKGFGVTVEADGGSSVPTLPILLAGTAG